MKAELTKRLKQLEEAHGQVENSVYILLLFGSLTLGSFIFSALVNSPLGPHIGMDRPGNVVIGMTLIFVIPLATSVLVLSTVPRLLRRIRDRQAALISARLQDGSLAKVVIDQALWEPVYALMQDEPHLHWTGKRRPENLPEQIELCADYWRAALLLEQGELSKLPAAVRSGSRSCRIDNMVSASFSSCALIIWLLAAQLLVPLLLPFLIPAFATYLRQRATQIALLKYFIELA